MTKKQALAQISKHFGLTAWQKEYHERMRIEALEKKVGDENSQTKILQILKDERWHPKLVANALRKSEPLGAKVLGAMQSSKVDWSKYSEMPYWVVDSESCGAVGKGWENLALTWAQARIAVCQNDSCSLEAMVIGALVERVDIRPTLKALKGKLHPDSLEGMLNNVGAEATGDLIILAAEAVNSSRSESPYISTLITYSPSPDIVAALRKRDIIQPGDEGHYYAEWVGREITNVDQHLLLVTPLLDKIPEASQPKLYHRATANHAYHKVSEQDIVRVWDHYAANGLKLDESLASTAITLGARAMQWFEKQRPGFDWNSIDSDIMGAVHACRDGSSLVHLLRRGYKLPPDARIEDLEEDVLVHIALHAHRRAALQPDAPVPVMDCNLDLV